MQASIGEQEAKVVCKDFFIAKLKRDRITAAPTPGAGLVLRRGRYLQSHRALRQRAVGQHRWSGHGELVVRIA